VGLFETNSVSFHRN